MVELIPAVLENDPARFADRVRTAATFTSFLHIDICDGKYVPSVSVDVSVVQQHAPAIPFSLHLMITDPLDHLDGWIATGAARFIIHCTGVGRIDEVCARLESAQREIVLAVHPKTVTEDLACIEARVTGLVEVLFVAVPPGFQGGQADERVLDSVAAFRREHPEIAVAVDGGLHRENISRYRNTGATSFIVGSAVWDAPDPAAAYRQLLTTFNR